MEYAWREACANNSSERPYAQDSYKAQDHARAALLSRQPQLILDVNGCERPVYESLLGGAFERGEEVCNTEKLLSTYSR